MGQDEEFFPKGILYGQDLINYLLVIGLCLQFIAPF
jgi:hypothetical protein